MLDPNCRPALVPDVDAYRRRLDHYFARADVVKVSADDLRFLYPGATSDEGARSILETGGQLVIVTDGPHPVTLHQSCGTLSVPVPQVEVVTTVGAGDAFVGGFLAWLMAGGLGRHSLVDIDLEQRQRLTPRELLQITVAVSFDLNVCREQRREGLTRSKRGLRDVLRLHRQSFDDDGGPESEGCGNR